MVQILSLQDIWVCGLQTEEQVAAGALYLAAVALKHCIISIKIATMCWVTCRVESVVASRAACSRWWRS